MCLSYAYMELRHYTEAISCLNESLEYAEEKVPDLFFRRAQAIYSNKYSNNEDLNNALNDVNKAISLKKEQIHIELVEKITSLIEKNKKIDKERITSKI